MQAWGEKPHRHGVVTGDIVGFVPGGKALSSTLTYAANYEYESKPGKAPAALTYVANYDYASKPSTPEAAGAASSSHHAAELSLDVPPGVLAARTTLRGGPVQ